MGDDPLMEGQDGLVSGLQPANLLTTFLILLLLLIFCFNLIFFIQFIYIYIYIYFIWFDATL